MKEKFFNLGVESQTEHTFVRNWLLNFDIERNNWYTSGVVSLEQDTREPEQSIKWTYTVV